MLQKHTAIETHARPAPYQLYYNPCDLSNKVFRYLVHTAGHFPLAKCHCMDEPATLCGTSMGTKAEMTLKQIRYTHSLG